MINTINAVKEGMPYKIASKQFWVLIAALWIKGENVQAVDGTKVLENVKKYVFTDKYR